MPWGEVLRLINALGCGIALGLLVSAAHQHWRDWNPKTVTHWWALVGWIFLGFEGAIENIILGTEPGPRTIIQTLVITWTLRALTYAGKLESEYHFTWHHKENQ